MKRLTIVFFSFVLFPMLIVAKDNDANKVKKVFDKYKTCALNGNGEQALLCVNEKTISYFDSISNYIRSADSLKIETLSIFDKVMILTVRLRVPKDDILKFDGKSLFIYSIDHGMVGKNGISNLELGKITIVDNFAKAQLVSKGKAVPFYYHFYNENDSWKMDMTSILPLSVVAFKMLIANSGKKENDYLMTVLEMVSGHKPGPEIWLPIE